MFVVSTTVPCLASRPDDHGPSARDEMLPGAVAVTGTASSVETANGSAPVLYLGYPMEPGQTAQRLYGAFVTLVQDANTRLLISRIRSGGAPRVLLTRPSGAGPWRVAAILPR